MSVFDKYAENYDEGHVKAVALSGFKPDFFHEYKLKELVRYLKAEGLADKKLKLLDFGCGIGRSAKYIKKYLPKASIYGVDVSKEEIRVAKASSKNLKNVTLLLLMASTFLSMSSLILYLSPMFSTTSDAKCTKKL